MKLLLVRHAHAGSKDRWKGDDRLRPLSGRGRAEARALADVLVPHRPLRIVSSPLARCLETLEPLAARLSIPVETSDRLGPDADRDATDLLSALAAVKGTVVVCTHGETIQALQRNLSIPGKHRFAPGGPHEKGSVWVLTARRGSFVSARYHPPGAGAHGAIGARSTPGGPGKTDLVHGVG